MRIGIKFFAAASAIALLIAPAKAQFTGSESMIHPPKSVAVTKPRRARHWWERRAPARDNATEQLKYADELRKEGYLRGAARHYRILTFAWSNSPEAPIAQFQYARILQERGKLKQAFDEYQYLLDTYSGFFPYNEVLEQQHAIADTTVERRKRVLLFTYLDESEAIPMFEQLVANAPAGQRAPELQFRIARIFEKNKEYDLALDAYSAFLQRYPLSPLAETAFFSNARCWHLYSARHSNDVGLREQAVIAQHLFLNSFPAGDKTETVRSYLRELEIAQADYLYQQARLYDIMARHAGSSKDNQLLLTAAGISYQRVIREFPDSRWGTAARARVDQIEYRQQPALEKK